MMLHNILFTGHMIDREGRPQPRFPPEKEQAAKEAIRKAVLELKEKYDTGLQGIAGGACGGDILFHEVCEELDIHSEVYLALPPDQFAEQSVAFAGPSWVQRFRLLIKNHQVHILPKPDKTSITDDKTAVTVWEQANLWMLKKAFEHGGEAMSLVALWDKQAGDGKGGTEHLVKESTRKGAEVIIIEPRLLQNQ
jgi:hypothetical protein